jgi:hypothetical protein
MNIPAIMKGLSGIYCHAKNLIRRDLHTSEEAASLLGADQQDPLE